VAGGDSILRETRSKPVNGEGNRRERTTSSILKLQGRQFSPAGLGAELSGKPT
jgi:hypothetical protein